MEAVAQLEKNFAGLKVVRAPEREAVIEQHTAIGNIGGLKVDGEALAKLLAE